MNEMRKQPALESPAAVPGPTAAAGPDAGEARSVGKPTPASARKAPSRAPFRTRLFAMLLLFAVIPTVAVTLVWAGATSRALQRFSARSAWERIVISGEQALRVVDSAPLTPAQRSALARHEAELRESAELARRFDFVIGRSMRLVVLGGVAVVVLVAIGASRVAGHLSRQLSRPLDELVGWTGLIRAGRTIPVQTERRGAPEFEVLRTGMRTMAQELETGRRRALEAERAEAFRESARRFAHELKNPLTPIRFAVDRLRRTAPDELLDTVEVLAEEATRLELMAKSFAQFGRLPDGPPADVDVTELVTRVAQTTVPDWITLDLQCAPAVPLVRGYYEPLVRAVSNVLINAVDACGRTGSIAIRVGHHDREVVVTVRDTGCGIAPDQLARVFDPYVTTKPGGTGLGLAIARQTVEAHHGRISAASVVGEGTTMTMRLPIGELSLLETVG